MVNDERAYNHRQLKLMEQTIERFRRGEIGIGKLVSDLDALVSALHNPDESWRKAFASDWGKLEDIHAMLLTETEPNLRGSDHEDVANALAGLVSLIQSEINR